MAENYFRQWITATGLRQGEVAALCGYTTSQFSKIVNGGNKLSREKRIAIATALSRYFEREVKPDDLLRPPNVENLKTIETSSPTVPSPLGKGVQMLELAKPVIAALVAKLGANTVARLALEAEREEETRPLERQKTL